MAAVKVKGPLRLEEVGDVRSIGLEMAFRIGTALERTVGTSVKTDVRKRVVACIFQGSCTEIKVKLSLNESVISTR